MLSATSKTSLRLWLIKTTASPLSAKRRTRFRTCSVCATPRAAVGSSRITTLLFHRTARAIATVWRCPPERDATVWRIDLTVRTLKPSSCRSRFLRVRHSQFENETFAPVAPLTSSTCSRLTSLEILEHFEATPSRSGGEKS